MNKSSNQNKILIVEDDAIVASQLLRTLNKMGYVPMGPVATGKEAVEFALREYPDVILMDIKLKGDLTGIEAADIIHNEAEIPVIYLTAYADQETIESSKGSHTYGFLAKPVRDKELGAMLETALYKSSTDRSLKHLNQLLRAIRSIDKLITKESVPEKLLQEACKILVDSKDYIVTWISNESDPTSNPMMISEKFGKSFSGGITNHFLKQKVQDVLNIELPFNKATVLRDSSGMSFFNKIFQNHNLKYPSAIISPMQYREKFYGYLVVFSDSIYSFDIEEIELLQTLAEDLAFALNNIQVEKERILAEQALSESEAYFRSLLHSMHEDILVIDRDYNIVDANNSVLKTTGHQTSEIIGKKCYKISHNLDHPCCENGEKCELQNIFENGTPKLLRQIHKKTDGSPVYVDVLYSPFKDETGRVIKVIQSIHDVTDLLSTRQALSDSEARINQIAENIDIVLFTLKSDDSGEKLTYLSSAFDRVWGIESKSAIDNISLWLDSIYPQDRKKLLDSIHSAKSSKDFIGMIEYRIVRSDGSTRWISSKLKKVNSNFNDHVEIIGIAEDITERILTENKLKRSEQAYKNLFNNAHDPIVIFKPESGLILNTNLKACEAYGYSISELIGKSFYELCVDRNSIFENVNDIADNKDVPTFELESIKKDQSSIFFEINLSLTDYLGGKAIISLNRDITFRKQAENELRILSEIVKQSPTSVLLMDINNKIEYANPKYIELRGVKIEDIIGKEAAAIKPLNNEDASEIWNKVKGGSIWKGEVMNVKANKISYWASLSISPIKNERGEVVHYLSIERDITEQKTLEMELKVALNRSNEISNFKTHLLGNLNHEIRTPMNSIIGFSQIMVEEVEDENVVEMSNKIIKSSYRLLNTLNSIIELSDLESERVKVNRTDVNLSHFVRYIEYSYKSIAKEKNLDFEVEFQKEDIIVTTDEKLLEQVLKNLIDNAIKYTEMGGIKISASEIIDYDSNKYCAIKIKDTGIGIPEKGRNMIFDAFKQLSEGVTRRYEGTGLGLTVAQKMVGLLDGKLEIESREGDGTTFSVILPLPLNEIVPEFKEAITDASEIKIPPLSGSVPQLLIVEDYLMNVDIMKYFLNDIAVTDNTINYEETMAAVQKKTYDMILMDINLKDSLGGIELLKEIRKIDQYKETPIIAITGYTSSMDQDTFMKEGFTGFLAKPFNQKQLRDIIVNNL